jgi:hypothetical protein
MSRVKTVNSVFSSDIAVAPIDRGFMGVIA